MKREDLPKYFEVSAGLLVGYIIMATIFATRNGQSIKAALLETHIITGIAGLLMTGILFLWKRRRER